jgi:uncharacterized membrane protein YdfJ with MMPL/SSD domain
VVFAGATLPPKTKPNLGSRWAAFVLRRPLPVLLLAATALGVVALPAPVTAQPGASA